MEEQKERRRWPRDILQPSKNGIIYPKAKKDAHSVSAEMPDTLHVNVLNISKRGLLIETPLNFRVSSFLDMRIWHPQKEAWMILKGKVIWTDNCPHKPGYYLMGIEFHTGKIDNDIFMPVSESEEKRMTTSDLEFLLNTNLFNSIPQESISPLLNNLSFKHFRAGERFIKQGAEGDSLYIIRSGSCIVNMEKENALHSIARLKAGDIVGEMAVLTGARRSTHVDAETDICLWRLSRAKFDALSQEYPDLRNILTEIVTNRISTSKLTAFRTIGKYIIKENIGQGAWSTVYKGVHGKLNFPVAIKMLKHTMAMDPEFSEKFQNEAKTIARLNHPNIVKVYDIEELYRTVFIMMEYLEGSSLEDVLEHLPNLSLSRILDIILQVCAGLDYAHKNGVIHQDIKPANIFIQPDGIPKIVDFGLACPPGSMDFNLPGTIYYMAPEQIQGEPVDERTDIYALGITAYEMITGRRPFPEDDLAALMDLHLKEDVPDPRQLVPDLPDELHNFIVRSVRKDSGSRFRNMTDITNMLQPLAEKMGLVCQPQEQKKGKMMGLFLFYQDDQQLALNQLIDKFSNDISSTGADLRITQVEDI